MSEQTRLEQKIEQPEQVSRANAQARANFLILYPTTVPDDIALVMETFRPELPPGRPDGINLELVKASPWTDANPCTLRSAFAGNGRRLRIKQFFYDWAPPAATIAALWDSSDLVPLFCGRTIGWVGTDYKGGRGASIERYGTQVELSVLEGAFSDEEIGEFLGSLQPACPDVFDKVPRSHKQNYWIRYKVPPLRTPHGLWVYPHRRAYDGTSVIETSEERILDWWCASAVAMSAEYDNRPHRDHERVFLHEADPDAWAIVSSIPLDSPASFAFPPVLEKQQIRYHEIWDIDACQIFAAAVDPEFGGWDLRWEMDGIGHSLWTSASRLWSRSSVEEFARQLV